MATNTSPGTLCEYTGSETSAVHSVPMSIAPSVLLTLTLGRELESVAESCEVMSMQRQREEVSYNGHLLICLSLNHP